MIVDLDAGGTNRFLIQPPSDKDIVFVWNWVVDETGTYNVYLRNNVVASNDGTNVDIFNVNENSDSTTATLISFNPVLSDAGDIVGDWSMPGGTSMTLGNRESDEWGLAYVLKRGEKYVFEFVSNEVSQHVMNVKMHFYEKE
jgi:hypothetical protein